MDSQTFDDLARRLSVPGSRRRVLGGMLAGALALVGVRSASAGKEAPEPINPGKRATGDICRKNGDCASDSCVVVDRIGRKRCGCQWEGDCPDYQLCEAGICVGQPG